MKTIMSANLSTTNTGNEYQWIESNEMESGVEWNGDVKGYVENLDCDGSSPEIMEAFDGAIHNLPNGAIIVGLDGCPHSIYWAEESSDA